MIVSNTDQCKEAELCTVARAKHNHALYQDNNPHYLRLGYLLVQRIHCNDAGLRYSATMHKINDLLQSFIFSAAISDVNGDEEDEKKEDSRTELDSHANMPVVRTADVKAYTPDYDSMQIRIVDAAVKYGCLRDVHDTPKIQVFDPNDKDHSIYFPGTKLRIPLSLCGVFSYFPTSNPTALEMMESEEVYMLSPSR
jgi:hypothetical protein